MVFSWIFNEFDLKMKISWAINGEFLRAISWEFHRIFNTFFMGFPWEKSHELKLHENLVIFPLKFSQHFHGFWFHSESEL